MDKRRLITYLKIFVLTGLAHRLVMAVLGLRRFRLFEKFVLLDFVLDLATYIPTITVVSYVVWRWESRRTL